MYVTKLEGSDVDVYNEENLLVLIDGFTKDSNHSVEAYIEINWAIDIYHDNEGLRDISYTLISYTGEIDIEVWTEDGFDLHKFDIPAMGVIFELEPDNNGIYIEGVEIDFLTNTIKLLN